jgi:CelD/BcsL family acetyltransferase involved in cellulose biosynthesis
MNTGKMGGFRWLSLSSMEELSDFALQWECLKSRIPRSTVFQSWEWCSCWWEVFGENYDQLEIICIYDGDELVMVLPLAIKLDSQGCRTFFILGDDLSDYEDLLVKPGYEWALGQVILKAMETHSVTRFYVRYLPSWSPLNKTISELRQNKFVRAKDDPFWKEASFYQIILPVTWDLYLQNDISQRQRKNIRHAFRDAERKGLKISCSDHPNSMEINQLIDLHCSSFEQRGFSPSPFTEIPKRRFLEMGLARMFSTGQARLFTLLDQSRVVGFDIVLKDKSWFYGYLTGINVDYLDISPGTVLKASMIQNAIENGYSGIDFGMGDEGYKAHWCNKKLPVLVTTLDYEGVISGLIHFLQERVRFRTRVKSLLSSTIKRPNQIDISTR